MKVARATDKIFDPPGTSRRQLMELLSGFALAAATQSAIFAQTKPPVRAKMGADGELAEASYDLDGAEIRMVITKKIGSRRSARTGKIENAYVVEIDFQERGEPLLRASATLMPSEGRFGTVMLAIEGKNYNYQITVDASDVPLSDGPPTQGVAKVSAVTPQGKRTGTFDLKTWQLSNELRVVSVVTLPADVQGKIAPFQKQLTLMVDRIAKQSPVIAANPEKPPVSFWRRDGCGMACWGIAGAGVAIACVGTAGTACIVASGALNAAAQLCSSHCQG
jgi:hypothetical protein